ncbi:MAG TPA: TRAM domain-containing protein [Thermoanaerobaculia bacterium]|jgi:tRNA/tmRNA/rRNA uracil-C5-methylase (TrmA/RlmC/RlmD family)
MQVGDTITIEATELVSGGEALARVDGFPIFATNVFPGDVAEVRLWEVKKGYAKAELHRLISASPDRRLEPCPIANECGGCDWTAYRLDKQLEAKQRILSESLRRIGKFDVAALPAVKVHPSPLNYRLRSRLHREGDAVGFYAMRSNRVVPLVPECEVVGLATAQRVASRGTMGPIGQMGPDDADLWEINDQLILDDRELSLRVNQYTYRLSTRSFFQVNRHLLGTMLNLVGGLAARTTNRHRAIDLYAGVGFFTLPLSDAFHRVVAVEGSPVSARYMRKNVPRSVKVVEAPVERYIERMPDADLIFLDPPRAGAKREVISTVAERAKEIIAYLSCDPVTFARDAARLTASGWRLSTLDLLDLFPNTHHVETLSSFERAR